MNFKSAQKAAVLVAFAIATSSPTRAYNLSSIQNLLEPVEPALTSPIGISVATLAVIPTWRKLRPITVPTAATTEQVIACLSRISTHGRGGR